MRFKANYFDGFLRATFISQRFLVGGFKFFLFSSILGEDSHFD